MQMLYDSDGFVVVHIDANEAEFVGSPRLARNGFEIVDKQTNRFLYLDGGWADVFQQQVTAWQVNIPTQEEVEAVLEGYSLLAHYPLVMH